MNQRSMRVLEWDKVLARVSEYASFSMGKKRVSQLLPSSESEVVQENLALTTKAAEQLWKHNDPPFGGAVDIQAVINRAKIGGILDGSQLLQVAGVLYCAGQIRQYLGRSEDDWEAFTLRLAHLPHIVADIHRCLGDEGMVKDTASPELASIRQRMRSLANRVRDKLDSIVHSSRTQKLLQESIITLRSGRYVVPVKAEHKSQFPGIVHDQSASGATFFMEPAAVVELNNQLRLAEQDEKREIQRILRRLSRLVEAEAQALTTTILTLAELDFIFAKAKYSHHIEGVEPKITQRQIRIIRGRHPLLDGHVVPVDLWIGDKYHILVITGPNTGGKTVTLKTVGLFCLMAQAGLHIPAQDGSEIAVFDGIYADIGDEQSIEQSLSTFSSHMSNIVGILNEIDSRSLVLLDELGAGTDPTEGAALATSLLEFLRVRQVTTVATTHYSELKNFAYANDDVENASVEFDIKTLRPTYHLSIGIPGKSNAFAIASQLGLCDEVVQKAKSMLSDEQVHVEDLIGEIETNRRTSRQEREEAERLRADYEKLKERYNRMTQEVAVKRNALMEDARREAEGLVNQAKRDLDLLVGELRRQQNVDLEKLVHEKRLSLTKQQRKLQAPPVVKPVSAIPDNLKVGEQVRINSLNQVGHVIQFSSSGDEVQVQAGIMKVNVKLSDLERVKEVKKYGAPKSTVSAGKSKSATISPELDLRGLTVEEALISVDKYIDDAFLSSLAQVLIIHGKGTGALRDAIREQLKNHPQVKAFRLGDPSEGGSGVTAVELNPR